MSGMDKIKEAKKMSTAKAGSQDEKMIYGGEPKNDSPLKRKEALGAVQEGDKYLSMSKKPEMKIKG